MNHVTGLEAEYKKITDLLPRATESIRSVRVTWGL